MDQASELRQLVRQDAAHVRPAPDDAPHVIAVASGKGGVGTTTVAVNLAATLVRLGRRVLLVDADLDSASVARHCGIDAELGIAEVLRGSRSVHEVLCRAAGGMQVLPGGWLADGLVDCTAQAQERLFAELHSLGAHLDDIVLDVGCGISRQKHRFWHAADKVVVVATPDDAAVMNVYAAIKLICGDDLELPVFSLINLAPDAPAAAAVHDRLKLACQRFLGRYLFTGGYLPAATEVRNALQAGEPFVLSAPSCDAALEMEHLARQLIAPRSEPPAPRMLERLRRRQTQAAPHARSSATRS
jgi:flagellar biosynthesis protein FlhG